jgi:hypothetical protein
MLVVGQNSRNGPSLWTNCRNGSVTGSNRYRANGGERRNCVFNKIHEKQCVPATIHGT